MRSRPSFLIAAGLLASAATLTTLPLPRSAAAVSSGITGRVIESVGQPDGGAQVVAYDAFNNTRAAITKTATDGSFRLVVPGPGNYLLLVQPSPEDAQAHQDYAFFVGLPDSSVFNPDDLGQFDDDKNSPRYHFDIPSYTPVVFGNLQLATRFTATGSADLQIGDVPLKAGVMLQPGRVTCPGAPNAPLRYTLYPSADSDSVSNGTAGLGNTRARDGLPLRVSVEKSYGYGTTLAPGNYVLLVVNPRVFGSVRREDTCRYNYVVSTPQLATPGGLIPFPSSFGLQSPKSIGKLPSVLGSHREGSRMRLSSVPRLAAENHLDWYWETQGTAASSYGPGAAGKGHNKVSIRAPRGGSSIEVRFFALRPGFWPATATTKPIAIRSRSGH